MAALSKVRGVVAARWGRSAYAAGCIGAAICAASFPAAAATTPTPAPLNLASVYLGGVTRQMSNLGTASTTTNFRAYGGGFYAHETYVLANTSGRCPAQKASTALAATIKVFKDAPPPLAELGIGTPFGLTQLLSCNYHAVGLYPQVALVNIQVGSTSLADWQAYVTAGKASGLLLMAPIVSPNVASNVKDWNNSYWNTAKQMALYGGALALDTPPLLYTALGAGYTTFAQQQMAWARQHGVVTVVILSPSNGEKNFTEDAVQWSEKIADLPGSVPNSYVIENYNMGTSPDIGTETTANTLANAAMMGAHVLQ